MRKNNLDEMQEKKLLQIEHNGMCLGFWGLVAAILIQSCLGADLKEIAGELILLMLISLYTLVACLKNGIWDRHLRPRLKTNALVSSLAAIVVAALNATVFFSNTQETASMLIPIIILEGLFTFLLCLFALQVSSHIYKKRTEKIDQACDKEDKLK